MYYLKSRYYDPIVGRFVSQDDVDYADYQSIGGLNLYVYCNNNPVTYSDPSGHSLIGALIAAFVLLCTPISGAIAQAATKSRLNITYWDFLKIIFKKIF